MVAEYDANVKSAFDVPQYVFCSRDVRRTVARRELSKLRYSVSDVGPGADSRVVETPDYLLVWEGRVLFDVLSRG